MAGTISHTMGVIAAAGAATVTISGTTFIITSVGGSGSTVLTASGSGISSYAWTIESTTGTGTWSFSGSTTSSTATVQITGNFIATATIRCTINGSSTYDEVTIDATTI